MKTTLLIGTKLNTVTLVIEPETATQRIILEELQRRGVTWEVQYGVALPPANPKPTTEPDREDARPTVSERAMPENSVQDLALQVLDGYGGIFDARWLRDAMTGRFPHKRAKIVTGVYPAIRRLQLLGKIQIVPGGYQVVATPPGVVMTAAAETVAH